MNNKTLFITLTVFAIFLCICCLCTLGIGGVLSYEISKDPEIQALMDEIMATATPTPAPKINREPLLPPADDSAPTETLLNETEVPIRDLRALASRLKFGGQELPETVNPSGSTYAVGDKKTFWVSDDTGSEPRQLQIEATLHHVTAHTYWWVDDAYSVDEDDLHRSAEVFESKTYPTNHEFFGTEWNPGVDNDPHLHIFLGNVPGVGGYYASLNEFSREVAPQSNEGEMFFINLRVLHPGNDDFDSVLAHEFQHMIHWYQDRNEETWVNEGLSELAGHLNGYDPDSSYLEYLDNPDLQLTTWSQEPGSTIPYYGYSYLFMLYFLEQFGEDTLKSVVAASGNGIQGFEQGLEASGHNVTFDAVFGNFIIANYLDENGGNVSQWQYDALDVAQPKLDTVHRQLPVARKTTVRQYGVDYIEIRADTDFTIEFTGSTTIEVVDNAPFSGRYQWYSNRGDDSNATLTRAFDLSGVSEATLTYQAWFDIEEDWDYAYVEVSTDGGRSWTVLDTPSGRDTNPSGNSYGTGYTGKSNGWLEERVDLSPYTGQEILLRFEYVTDDAVNNPGFTLDDVAIPEIGFFDDMESHNPAWIAAGFIRMDNQLKQRFIVQVIEKGAPPNVLPLTLDETNVGRLTIDTSQSDTFVLVVSAQAPVTTEPASYEYRIGVTPIE